MIENITYSVNISWPQVQASAKRCVAPYLLDDTGFNVDVFHIYSPYVAAWLDQV